MRKSFPAKIVEEFTATKYIYIRSGYYRFVPIWVVVVDGRVIVRSWNDKESGWYRAFLEQPNGDFRLTGREVPVRAILLRSQRINDAADEAYAAKYTTKANLKYVAGFKTARRKATTLELVPR